MTANQLHFSKLEEFKDFLDRNDVPWRASSAAYQVIQVLVNKHWIPVYKRKEAKEHFSTETRLEPLVRQFLHKAYMSPTGRLPMLNVGGKLRHFKPSTTTVDLDFANLELRVAAMHVSQENEDF